MDWAHQELIRRAKEKEAVAPLILYGDFLRDRRRDPMAAADQYRAAMMWDADDAVTRAKVADIYLELVRQHYEKKEYVGAETRLREAEKYAVDPVSPQGQRLADYRRRLAALRN
jgi:hypothetical protein